MTTKWGQFHGYCFEVPATATPAITPHLPLKEIIYKNRMKISYLHLLLFLVSFLSAYGNDIVVTWGDGDRGGYSSGVVLDSSGVGVSSHVSTIYSTDTAFAAIMNDADGDGVTDSIDAFPDDPTESVDTDSDNLSLIHI